MPQYRKKPVVIEAIRFLGGRGSEIDGPEPHWYEIARTIDRGKPGSITFSEGTLRIQTLEGVMTAEPGDWILQGVQGELYPCKDAIFRATYEPAEHTP